VEAAKTIGNADNSIFHVRATRVLRASFLVVALARRKSEKPVNDTPRLDLQRSSHERRRKDEEPSRRTNCRRHAD
jgi:hypothetical protein